MVCLLAGVCKVTRAFAKPEPRASKLNVTRRKRSSHEQEELEQHSELVRQLSIPGISDTSAVIIRSGLFLFQLTDSNVFFNLINHSTGNGQLVVSGSALAAQSGNVSIVSTYFNTCGNVFSPTDCANHTGGEAEYLFTKFTAVTLSSPVQVSAGQTVAATVTISFS